MQNPQEVGSKESVMGLAVPARLLRKIPVPQDMRRIRCAASDRLHWITRAITKVTRQYRTIMYHIHERRRTADISTKSLVQSLRSTTSRSPTAIYQAHTIERADGEVIEDSEIINVHERHHGIAHSFAAPLVRRLQSTMSTSATVIDQANTIRRAISSLTREYEAIISTIHQRHRRNKAKGTWAWNLRHKKALPALQTSFNAGSKGTQTMPSLLSEMRADVDEIAAQVRLRSSMKNDPKQEKICIPPIRRIVSISKQDPLTSGKVNATPAKQPSEQDLELGRTSHAPVRRVFFASLISDSERRIRKQPRVKRWRKFRVGTRHTRRRNVSRFSKPSIRKIRNLSLRRHVTIAPMDRKLRVRSRRNTNGFKPASFGDAQMRQVRQRARPRRSAAKKATEMEQNRQQLLNVVGSWLGGTAG
jgi:hypothetical protein